MEKHAGYSILGRRPRVPLALPELLRYISEAVIFHLGISFPILFLLLIISPDGWKLEGGVLFPLFAGLHGFGALLEQMERAARTFYMR